MSGFGSASATPAAPIAGFPLDFLPDGPLLESQRKRRKGGLLNLVPDDTTLTEEDTSSSRFRGDYAEHEMIGKGSFSEVFRVRHKLDGSEYAVKRSLSRATKGGRTMEQLVREARILALLRGVNNNI
jgi:serine/threonine protein kinase